MHLFLHNFRHHCLKFPAYPRTSTRRVLDSACCKPITAQFKSMATSTQGTFPGLGSWFFLPLISVLVWLSVAQPVLSLLNSSQWQLRRWYSQGTTFNRQWTDLEGKREDWDRHRPFHASNPWFHRPLTDVVGGGTVNKSQNFASSCRTFFPHLWMSFHTVLW